MKKKFDPYIRYWTQNNIYTTSSYHSSDNKNVWNNETVCMSVVYIRKTLVRYQYVMPIKTLIIYKRWSGALPFEKRLNFLIRYGV